jgi:tRNA (cmo5U34)-methyltransferase
MKRIRPLWRIPLIAVRERRHGSGRERIPEPMVMNDPDSVAQFHDGGVSNPGQIAVYDFSARALDALVPEGGRLLDLGVGSGRALNAFLRRRPDVTAVAVDLAPNMLATAQHLFRADGVDKRVELVEADITALPDRLAHSKWDAVSCVWTLHQLPDVNVLRGALRQIAALRQRCGAAIWIFDFQRLKDPSALEAMITILNPSLAPVLRKDALASEAAAFTASELSAELAAAGLNDMRSGHAGPLPWMQGYWLPSTSSRTRSRPLGIALRLAGHARLDAALFRWGFSAKPF